MKERNENSEQWVKFESLESGEEKRKKQRQKKKQNKKHSEN